MSLIDAIDANLDNLVDPKNRCVEATDAAANELVIAATEESPDELQEIMFYESSNAVYAQSEAEKVARETLEEQITIVEV
jgi:hypothetical protein